MGRMLRVMRERPEIPLAVLVFVLFIGGWEAVVRVFDIPAIVIPAPTAVLRSLWFGIGSASFQYAFLVTLYETVAGFALGSVCGLILGGLVAQFALLEKTVYPYIVAFQTVPKVAIAPIVVIWFGYGLTSKVIITAMIAFFPVLANTIVGLRATPAEQIELMVAFTATRGQIFFKAKLPQALPYIFVGLDVAIVLSVIGAIVGEFVGAQAGLGYMILQSNFSMDIAGVFAILIVLSAMGVGLHAIVHAVQRRVVFWMDSSGDRVVGA